MVRVWVVRVVSVWVVRVVRVWRVSVVIMVTVMAVLLAPLGTDGGVGLEELVKIVCQLFSGKAESDGCEYAKEDEVDRKSVV